MNKVNLVGYGICALLAFPAMAETEDVKQNPEAVLASDETGSEIAEEAYSTPGKVTASINLGTLSGEAKERVATPRLCTLCVATFLIRLLKLTNVK